MVRPMITTRVFETPEEVVVAGIDLLKRTIAAADASGDPTAIMLTGGSTPLAAYAILAKDNLPAPGNLTLFMSDERMVPLDSDQNNHCNALPFIQKVCPADEQQLRVQTQHDLEQAVRLYDHDLEVLLAKQPRMPLGLMGMGGDTHTAGLFSPDHFTPSTTTWTAGVHRPDGRDGVSVTPAFLENIDLLVFQVIGEGKAEAVDKLLNDPDNSIAAQAIAQCADVELWMDRAAAGSNG